MKIKNICFMNLRDWKPEDGLQDEVYKNFPPEEHDIQFYGSTAVGADRRNILVRGNNLDEVALIRAQKIASKYRKTVAVPNVEVATVDCYDPYRHWLGKKDIVRLPGQD